MLKTNDVLYFKHTRAHTHTRKGVRKSAVNVSVDLTMCNPCLSKCQCVYLKPTIGTVQNAVTCRARVSITFSSLLAGQLSRSFTVLNYQWSYPFRSVDNNHPSLFSHLWYQTKKKNTMIRVKHNKLSLNGTAWISTHDVPEVCLRSTPWANLT